METVWVFNVPLVLLVAAVLTAVTKLGDSYITRHRIEEKDEMVATFTYLVMGATIGLVINLLLTQTPAGAMIDSSYTTIGAISDRGMMAAFVSGAMGAIATAVYLFAFRKDVDPSLVVPLGTLVVAYVAVAEMLNGRVSFEQVALPVALVIVGVFVALMNKSTNWKVSGWALILLLVVYNGASATGELFSKNGVDASDAISFGFYRFLWLTAGAWVVAMVAVLTTGKLPAMIECLKRNLKAIPFIAVQMSIVFFALGWGNKGLALSSATVKNVVMSLTIILVVLLSALSNRIWPGAFEDKDKVVTTSQWLMRFVGAALMVWGVFLLQ